MRSYAASSANAIRWQILTWTGERWKKVTEYDSGRIGFYALAHLNNGWTIIAIKDGFIEFRRPPDKLDVDELHRFVRLK